MSESESETYRRDPKECIEEYLWDNDISTVFDLEDQPGDFV